MPAGSPSRAPVVWLALLLAAAAAALAQAYWAFSYDDAFITYRYALSWAARGALEYNAGERVLGTTAPGWAVALGLVTRVTGLPPPAAGTVLSVFALVALALLLQRVAARSGHSHPTLLAALFGLLALACRWNVEMLGAETFAVLALGVCGAVLALGAARAPGVAASRSDQVAGGLLLAAAMACRLDAALLAGAVGLVAWAERRRFPWMRFPWAFAAAGIGPLLAWLAWLQLHVGRVLPVTLAAKQAEAGGDQPAYGLAEWRWLQRSLGTTAALWLLALATAGAVALALAARRGRVTAPAARLALALGCWLLLHELAYRLLAVPFAPWYQLPLLQGVLAAAVGGALALGAATARQLTARAPRVAPVSALLVSGLLLLPPAATWVRWTVAHRHRPPDPRFDSYHALAQEVARRARPGDVVATMEIGVLGYYAPVRVLDLAGLVTPEVVAAGRAGALPRLVAAHRPRFVVDADAFQETLGPVLAAAGMAGRYRGVLELRHGDDPHRRLRLLVRRRETP